MFSSIKNAKSRNSGLPLNIKPQPMKNNRLKCLKIWLAFQTNYLCIECTFIVSQNSLLRGFNLTQVEY